MVDSSFTLSHPPTKEQLQISLRQIYSRGLARATPIFRSLNCKSPISKRSIPAHNSLPPAAPQDLCLLINSYCLTEDKPHAKTDTSYELGLPVHIRPLLARPNKRRVLSMSMEGSPFSVVGKQQLISTLPPARLHLLREKRFLHSTFNPLKLRKAKEPTRTACVRTPAKLTAKRRAGTTVPRMRASTVEPEDRRMLQDRAIELSGWDW